MTDKPAAVPVFSNPAAVGLAGFGGTTLLLQFHNLGLCGAGTVLWLAIFFGGLAQLVAGFQEFRTGNNFGFAAFTTYGAFWMALGGILLGKHFNILNITDSDVGWTLVVFTILTFIFLMGAVRQSGALGFLFLTLLIGFALLSVGNLTGSTIWNKVAAVDLIICALTAFYILAHIILGPMKVALPVGKPWVK